MKKPSISIIVPVYNVEEYIEKCIESLVNQTQKDIEIIFINDGSTDNSRNIISKYEKKYKNIKCIDKENEGQAVARNIAIKESHADYVMFVDADDYISPNMCEEMLLKIQKEDSDMAFSTSYFKVLNNEINEEKTYGSEQKDLVAKYLLTQSGPVNKLIKKELIINNELYFKELRAYEDISVVPSWALYANKISYINKSYYYYLIRDGSTMRQIKYNKKLEDIFSSLNNLLEKYNNSNNKNKYKEEIEWIFIEHLLHAASLRFFKFDNYQKNIEKINKTIKENFPNWRKNKYYKEQSYKYKIVCNLFYKEKYFILKKLLK